MWPAALIALAVGGPFGMCLMLAAGVVNLTRAWKVDAEFAKRGELPPTARLIDKWLDREKKAGRAAASETRKTYGSRAYAKQRWAAFWSDLGNKHKEVDAQYRKACDEAREAGRPLPPKPSQKEKLTGWKWHIDQLTAPATTARPDADEKPGQAVPAKPASAEPAAAEVQARSAQAGTKRGSDATPDLPIIGLGGANPELYRKLKSIAPEPNAKPILGPDGRMVPGMAWPRHGNCGKCGTGGALTAVGWCEPCVTATDHACCTACNGLMVQHADGLYYHGPHQGCAIVGDPNMSAPGSAAQTTREVPNTEGETMAQPVEQKPTNTQQNGEVVGLMSAINYAGAVADAHTAHSTGGGEQYMTSLSQAKVGPETLQSAARAQEASEIAAAAWKAHQVKLQEQIAAKEATTTETGKKDFLLAE